jgi:glycosyltransferase involved in cell wall biosynthesis
MQQQQQQQQQQQPSPLVSFVIPSVGRATLARSLDSLADQSDADFEAVLVLDGIPRGDVEARMGRSLSDPAWAGWLRVLETEKVGWRNCAGEVRNRAFPHCGGHFVAFLDDDDTLHRDYVRWLREEADVGAHPADVVIFRMWNGARVLPPPDTTDFKMCEVGISFAVRRALIGDGDGQILFQASTVEDYMLLDRLRVAGRRIVLAGAVAYFVRLPRSRDGQWPVFNRAFINL